MGPKIDLTPPFLRSVRRLERKYRRAASDLEGVIAAVALMPTLGAEIPGTGGVRKVRARSTDMGRGKSGGFRVLYVWDEPAGTARILFAYAKPEREDVSPAELAELLAELAVAGDADAEGDSAGGPQDAEGPEPAP